MQPPGGFVLRPEPLTGVRRQQYSEVMLNHYSSRTLSRTALSLALVVGMAGQARAQATPPQPAQHGANPTVSPDGRQITFVSDRAGTGEVYVMDADGSGLRRLTSDGGHRGRAYWSADGHRLLFSVSANDTARVFSLPVEGGAPAEIGRFPARTGAILLPDGARFLYGVGSWTETQLVTSRADGSDRLPLTSDHAAYWCPAVSPDGDQVAATRQDTTGMQIWIVSTDGSGARALTHFTRAQGRPQCAAYSPDGGRIAVQSEVPDPRITPFEPIFTVAVAAGARPGARARGPTRSGG